MLVLVEVGLLDILNLLIGEYRYRSVLCCEGMKRESLKKQMSSFLLAVTETQDTAVIMSVEISGSSHSGL